MRSPMQVVSAKETMKFDSKRCHVIKKERFLILNYFPRIYCHSLSQLSLGTFECGMSLATLIREFNGTSVVESLGLWH